MLVIDMSRKLSILAIGLFTSTVVFGAGTSGKYILLDGFVLAGVDGNLTGKDDRWFFEFDSDVSDDRGVVKAGAVIELLPSAALEKMTLDVEERLDVSYRLWGGVTKYKGRNFIFVTYFLPLSKVSKAQLQQPQGPQRQDAGITINEPNDTLTVPPEILTKLKHKKITRTAEPRKGLELKQDFILADRTGFISSLRFRPGQACVVRPFGFAQDKDAYCAKETTQYEFALDALGRNVQQTSLRLLPCQVLEQATGEQSDELEPLRFKIAGIVTKYKGEHYLLLQRSTRAYSHENFAR